MQARDDDDRTVVLGPMIEFHAGIHGSLADRPPPGITYRSSGGRVHYWHRPNPDWSPLADMAVDEVVELAPIGPAVERYAMHTSRVPASGRVPWVVDCDCLLATVKYGRDFMFGRAEAAPAHLDEALSALRTQRLARRYLADDCFGVLFNTATFRTVYLDYLDRRALLDDDRLGALADKCQVVVPAAAVSSTPRPARNASAPLRICYAARAGALKGQEVAEAVLAQVAATHGAAVELIWLGLDPPAAIASVAEVLPTLERHEYLDLISSCDVYFAPSTSETLGMAMLEAAALGTVVLTGAARGMPALHELFTDGEDAVVVPEGDRHERIQAYVEAIGALVDAPELLDRCSRTATVRAERRLVDRDERLLDRYDAMFEAFDAVSARAEPIPADGPLSGDLHKTSVDLSLLEAVYRKRWAANPQHLTFDDGRLRTAE